MAMPTVSGRDSTKGARPRSFFGIVAAVLGRPLEWFSGVDGSNVRRALGFVALVHLIVDPVQKIYDALLQDGTAQSAPLRALVFVVVGPLAAIVWVGLMALVSHGVVRLGARGPRRYALTLECIAYAQPPVLLWLVPPVANFVPLGAWAIVVVWCSWLAAVGLHTAVRTSWVVASLGALIGVTAPFVGGQLVRETYQAFRIPAASMAPTLVSGDRIFTDTSAYGWLDAAVPRRGDVIVFKFPERREQLFVKRVIGLPGDEISERGKDLFIDGWKVPSCGVGSWSMRADGYLHQGDLVVEFLEDRAYTVFFEKQQEDGLLDSGRSWTVAPGEVFVMGDNRRNSYDSREFFEGKGGGVRPDDVVGRGAIIWLSLDDAGGIVWPRVGRHVMDAPTCGPEFSAETCEGIRRCLAERPPREQTSPR